MNPIRIGILGAGAIGGEHAYCYGQMQGVEVVAVPDLRRCAAPSGMTALGAQPRQPP